MTELRFWVSVLLGLEMIGCGKGTPAAPAVIEFTRVPSAGMGGRTRMEAIEGKVKGAKPGQRIVLYARSGVWWVQPFANRTHTEIDGNSNWRNTTHVGTEYAALLVNASYVPLPKADKLPAEGGDVAAVSIVRGENLERLVPKLLHFSGYEWEIRQEPSDRGGTLNPYDPANAWVDPRGRLHLQITRKGGEWRCAEVLLRQSLGYGTYSFTVEDVSHFEPAAVLGMFTWDDQGSDVNHREVDIEISRWGDGTSMNAQYAIQPYYVPMNVARFDAPKGLLTHSFQWAPGRLSFRTARGMEGGKVVAENVFTSGVPAPGGESVRMNLYVYNKARQPVQKETEVVIEKFEYLP